jgi:palmitoyltransferase ZDHHC2/15/20
MFDSVKWCNIFQFCKCLKLLGHFMVLIVVGMFGLSWYSMVVECYGPLVLKAPPGLSLFSFVVVVTFTLLVRGILAVDYLLPKRRR